MSLNAMAANVKVTIAQETHANFQNADLQSAMIVRQEATKHLIGVVNANTETKRLQQQAAVGRISEQQALQKAIQNNQRATGQFSVTTSEDGTLIVQNGSKPVGQVPIAQLPSPPSNPSLFQR
jgi:hypothetical protein